MLDGSRAEGGPALGDLDPGGVDVDAKRDETEALERRKGRFVMELTDCPPGPTRVFGRCNVVAPGETTADGFVGLAYSVDVIEAVKEYVLRSHRGSALATRIVIELNSSLYCLGHICDENVRCHTQLRTFKGHKPGHTTQFSCQQAAVVMGGDAPTIFTDVQSRAATSIGRLIVRM